MSHIIKEINSNKKKENSTKKNIIKIIAPIKKTLPK